MVSLGVGGEDSSADTIPSPFKPIFSGMELDVEE